MNRAKARELAMQLIYQMEITKEFVLKDFTSSDINAPYIDKMGQYLKTVLTAFLEHKDEIDLMIEASLKNWKIGRLAKTDLSVLRIAVTEMLFVKDIPVPQIVKESVDLAKSFGTEKSGKFVNGILRNISENRI